MAFRGYELNLILRVSDRATSRLRRFSRDVGRMNQTEQIQHRMMQTQKQFAAQGMNLDATMIRSQEKLNRLGVKNVEMWANGRIVARNAQGQIIKLTNAQKAASLDLLATETKLEALAEKRLATEAALTRTMSRGAVVQGRGTRMAHVGGAAAVTGGIGVAVLGAAASKFADFDTQSRLAVTQTGRVGEAFNVTAERADKLQSVIEGMMLKYPAQADEMAKATYDIFSSMELAGNETQQWAHGMNLLARANDIAVANMSDLDTATNTMITVLNDFDPNLQHVNQTIDDMSLVIRFGRMNLETFNNMMNSVAPSARSAQQNLLEVGAAMAILTQNIPSQARAGTALARLFDVLQSKKFQEGMEMLGPRFKITDQSGKLLPLYKIIGKLVALRPELKQGGSALNNLILTVTGSTASTVQARRALNFLITDFIKYGKIHNEMKGQRKGQFMEQLVAQFDTAGVKWKVFSNRFRSDMLKIGQQVIPVFDKFGRILHQMEQRWEALPAPIRNFIVQATALSMVLLLISGIILTVMGGLLALRGTLMLVGESLGLTAGTGVLGRSTKLLGVLKALTLIGTVAITFEIMKKGNVSWSQLALLAVAAGLIAGPEAALLVGAVGGGLKLGTMLRRKRDESTARKQMTFKENKRATELFTGPLGQNMLNNLPFRDPTAPPAMSIEDFNRMANAMNKPMATRKNFDPKSAKQARKDEHTDALKRLQDMRDYEKELDKWTNKSKQYSKTFATEKVRAYGQAHKDMERDINSTFDNLAAKYDEFHKQQEGIFGPLFGGPVKSGPLGSIFTQINDMLLGFGAKPIATPGSILQKDLDVQLRSFKSFNSGLGSLARRGAPFEMIEQFRNQGISALPDVMGLNQMSQKQWEAFKKAWKSGKTEIDNATKRQMDDTLKHWQTYGSKIALAVINGVSSPEAQKALKAGYKTYIIDSFGSIFKDEMDAQIKASIEQWKKEHPAPKKPKAPAQRQTISTTTHTGDTYTVHADGVTPNKVVNAITQVSHRNKTRGRVKL